MAKLTSAETTQLTSAILLPIEGAMLLPRAVLPLHIFEPRFVELVDDVLKGDRMIGLIQPKTDDDKSDAPALHSVGTLGRLTHFEEAADDRYMIGLTGVTRFKLLEDSALDQRPYRQGRIDAKPFEKDLIVGLGEESVDRKRFVSILKEYAEFSEFELDWDEIEESGVEDLINSCSMAAPYATRERQALLEAEDLGTRAEMLMAFAEIEMSRKDSNITMQ